MLRVVLSLLLAAIPAQQSTTDPWSPGARDSTWDLVDRLQAWPAFETGEAVDLASAAAHRAPHVRAAAAWALGRQTELRAARLLASLVRDPDELVRQAAMAALVRSDDPASRHVVAAVLADWPIISGASLPSQLPGEPESGFGTLFVRGGLSRLYGFSIHQRRDWLAHVDPRRWAEPASRVRSRTGAEWLAARRSQLDADEPVVLRASIRVGERASWPSDIRGQLLGIDAPPAREGDVYQRSLRPAIDLRLRVSPGTTGEPGAAELRTSLHDIPPGVYVLKADGPANPLLLRIRRAPRREAAAQERAAQATEPEDLEFVLRQRVKAAAPRLVEQLRLELAGGPRPGARALHLGRVLAWLGETRPVEALLAAYPDRGCPFAWLSAHEAPFREDLGPALALPVRRAVVGWRDAVRGGCASYVADLLRSRWAGPDLDDARQEILEVLAPRVTPYPTSGNLNLGLPEAGERELFLAALDTIAAHRPLVAARALVSIGNRPALMRDALHDLEGTFWRRSDAPPSASVLDAVTRAAWEAASGEHTDLRAALAALGERWTVPLAGSEDALPATGDEALDEVGHSLRRDIPHRGLAATWQRVRRSPPAEQDTRVARLLSASAIRLERLNEALELAERALATSVDETSRRMALAQRAAAREASGDVGGAAADLEEATAGDPRSGDGLEDARQAAVRVRRLPRHPRLRIHVRTGIDSWRLGTVDARTGISVTTDELGMVVLRDLMRGGFEALPATVWSRAAMALNGPDDVAIVYEDGRVSLVRRGRATPVWETRLPQPSMAEGRQPMLTARTLPGLVLVVTDDGMLHALDGIDGRLRWSRRGVHRELHVAAPDLLLVVHCEREGAPVTLASLSARDGTVRWSRADRGRRALAAGPQTAAVLDYEGRLIALDVTTGNERFNVASPELAGTTWNVPTALALSPDGQRIYAARGAHLLAFTTDGTRVLTQTAPTDRAIGGLTLVATSDAVWWFTAGVRHGKHQRRVSIVSADGTLVLESDVADWLSRPPEQAGPNAVALQAERYLALWELLPSRDPTGELAQHAPALCVADQHVDAAGGVERTRGLVDHDVNEVTGLPRQLRDGDHEVALAAIGPSPTLSRLGTLRVAGRQAETHGPILVFRADVAHEHGENLRVRTRCRFGGRRAGHAGQDRHGQPARNHAPILPRSTAGCKPLACRHP